MSLTSLKPAGLVVAVVALCLTCGGVGYTAAGLPKNSVGSRQIKNAAIKAKDLKPGAVGSVAVQDGALTGADVAADTLTGADVAGDGLTGADIDESTLTVPSQTGFLVLNGYDFRIRTTVNTYGSNGDGAIFVVGPNPDVVEARVEIPVGATVTSASVYVVDNAASSVSARVRRLSPSTSGVDETDPVVSTGASSAIQTLTIPADFVADTVSTIVVAVQLPVGAAYMVQGARIAYTYDADLTTH
jgi:hypothetical protein